MIPCPIALGLTLCDYVSIERGTNKISLIGQFRQLAFSQFPAVAEAFWVAATVTESVGRGILRCEIREMNTLDVVFTYDRPLTLTDRFREFFIAFRIRTCRFQYPGWYSVHLLVDGEEIAARKLLILKKHPKQ